MKQNQEKVLMVAQEITFAKALSSNEKSLRERALRRLKKWLISKSQSFEKFTEEGFMRIWKGLFYCIWMSDKPLVQEDTVDKVSELVHCFSDFEEFLLFGGCFFSAMSQAWLGLDQFRLDKFMMLVRRCLRQHFEYLRRSGWKKKQICCYSTSLKKWLSVAPVGMVLHITEIYLEELAKIGKGSVKPKTVVELVRAFGELMATSNDSRILNAVSKNIFLYLIQQSELGIKFQTKFNAWRQMGFPGGTIDALEEVKREEDEDEMMMDEDGEEGDEGRVLDPRAGSVDVYLPPIEFDISSIINMLTSFKSTNDTTTRARKTIAMLNYKFSEFKRGRYPLGMKRVKLPEKEDEEVLITEAALKLLRQEENDDDDDDSDDTHEPKKHNGGKKKVKKMRPNKTEWEVRSIIEEPSSPPPQVSGAIDDHLASTCGQWEVTPISETSRKRKDNHNLNQNHKPANKKAKPTSSPNTTTTSWPSSEWDSPPKDGEIEIFIPNKNYRGRKCLNNSGSCASVEVGQQNTTMCTPPLSAQLTNKHRLSQTSATNTPTSAKKVAFVLNRNTTQDEREYKMALKEKPVIHYDGTKQPAQGVLKPSAVVSPINPFYRHIVKPFSINS